jgi:hypothetical protein
MYGANSSDVEDFNPRETGYAPHFSIAVQAYWLGMTSVHELPITLADWRKEKHMVDEATGFDLFMGDLPHIVNSAYCDMPAGHNLLRRIILTEVAAYMEVYNMSDMEDKLEEAFANSYVFAMDVVRLLDGKLYNSAQASG